jgi:hypothetical protein
MKLRRLYPWRLRSDEERLLTITVQRREHYFVFAFAFVSLSFELDARFWSMVFVRLVLI